MKNSKMIIIQKKRVFIDKIKYLKAERYLSTIHYDDGQIEVFSISLKKMEEILCDFGLYRISHSMIIDLNIFKSFIPNKRYHFLTTDMQEIKVSRAKWKEFKRIIYQMTTDFNA